MDFNMVEIVLLGGLAIIIFGPEKLPELARKAARVLAYLRKISEDARGQLREELGPEFDNFSLADLNPKTLVAKHLLSGEEVAD
ncbi:MAG: twin-arginine translocase TatA/TatE family subunit, partial [Propioniciclava sp.]